MSGAANRGRYAENKVREHLKAIEARWSNFTFNRNQDAHAARGAFVAVPGDFQAFKGWSDDAGQPRHESYILEVKEVAHASRLPYKNYSADKVARIRVRELCNCRCLVLVCHRAGGKIFWRAVPQNFFYTRNEQTPSGSWDLSEFPIVDFRVAINNLVGLELDNGEKKL